MGEEKSIEKRKLKALFLVHQLLGDALYATPIIAGFHKQYTDQRQDVEITVACYDDYKKRLFQRTGVPVTLLPCDKGDKAAIPWQDFDFVFDVDASKSFSLGSRLMFPCVMGYAVMSGVNIQSLKPIYILPDGVESPEDGDFVLFHPYSISCSSWTNPELPPNKRWPDSRWRELYWHIHDDFGFKVFVIGGPDDYIIEGIPDDAHRLGVYDLDQIVAMQAKAKLVVSIDTGLSHLASSQDAQQLELYPNCLNPRWMGKFANPNYQMIYAQPCKVGFDYVWGQVRTRLKRGLVAREKRVVQQADDIEVLETVEEA